MGVLEIKKCRKQAWNYHKLGMQELGEFEDLSDYIRDSLSDEEFPCDIIDQVVDEIAEEEGW